MHVVEERITDLLIQKIELKMHEFNSKNEISYESTIIKLCRFNRKICASLISQSVFNVVQIYSVTFN